MNIIVSYIVAAIIIAVEAFFFGLTLPYLGFDPGWHYGKWVLATIALNFIGSAFRGKVTVGQTESVTTINNKAQ